MDKGKCGNCIYWKTDEKAESGECHRHAPGTTALFQDRYRIIWAITDVEEFCGDHSPGAPRTGKIEQIKAVRVT